MGNQFNHIFSTSPHSVTLNLRLVFERSSHLFLLVWPPKPREKYFIAFFFFAMNALVLSLSLVLLVHLPYAAHGELPYTFFKAPITTSRQRLNAFDVRFGR